MKKTTLITLLLSLICAILSSCSANSIQVDITLDQLEYDNKIYHDTDNNGRIINSSWLIDKAYYDKTEKVEATLSFGGSKSKIKVKKFKDENLSMFLFDNDAIYCEEGFIFPDYRNNDEIEKIIIIPNANTSSDEENSIIIDKKEDIITIIKTLDDASDSENYKNNSFTEKTMSNDNDILIGYRNCSAVFYYGYISIDNNDKYGIYCGDVNKGNLLYTVDSEMINTLNKYNACPTR